MRETERQVPELNRRIAQDLVDTTGKGQWVYCLKCGNTQAVDPADCLTSGWPTCCGETMTIDRPGERHEDHQ